MAKPPTKLDSTIQARKDQHTQFTAVTFLTILFITSSLQVNRPSTVYDGFIFNLQCRCICYNNLQFNKSTQFFLNENSSRAGSEQVGPLSHCSKRNQDLLVLGKFSNNDVEFGEYNSTQFKGH